MGFAMKCPLCQIKTNAVSLLPYMGLEICESCWNLKNPDLNQSKIIEKPIQSGMEQEKPTRTKRPDKSHAIDQLQKIHAELKLIHQSIPDNNLKITDLNTPFSSMVVYMTKLAMASIPAMAIVFFLFFLLLILYQH